MNINTTLRSLLPPHFVLIALLFLATTTSTTAGDATRGLHVVVTRDGERITGLTADALCLTLDGQEVAISAWQEIQPTHRRASRRILVFIDEAFALPGGRDQALHGLRKAFQALPADLPPAIAVVTFDGERVELLTGWTSDRTELNAALEQAQQRPVFGLLRQSERLRKASLSRRRSRLPDAGSFSGTGFSGSTSSALEEPSGHADLLRRLARRSARAVAITLKAVADPRGGALVLLSGGWLPPSAPAAECETLAEPLLQAAHRFGFAIYPVDLASTPTTARATPAMDGLLQRLAKANGGSYTQSNTPQESAEATFNQALNDSRSYYRLDFPVPEEHNFEPQEVQVEIAHPNLAEELLARVSVLPNPAPGAQQPDLHPLFPLLFPEQEAAAPPKP